MRQIRSCAPETKGAPLKVREIITETLWLSVVTVIIVRFRCCLLINLIQLSPIKISIYIVMFEIIIILEL